ncbi:MAG: SDR family oxidoreductase [Cyclobacteriaceae bacterium]|nr:SDR family oxidoreductase [Cyclobacteriaceae bacterium]
MARILLTGTTGYIGKRLLPLLLQHNHEVYCVVRDRRRLDLTEYDQKWKQKIKVFESDFIDQSSVTDLPRDVDVAYYLIHSMTSTGSNFDVLEDKTSGIFSQYLATTTAEQVIYLGGIANDESLSKHLSSRMKVEQNLASSGIPVTVLRAAIIIGSGSASFEIIRDLVEKLPVMITPKWLNSRCQPIAISNVLQYLMGVILNQKTYGETYDIGGPDILTYRQMLLQYAEIRKLKRWILTLPVLTPRLSSLWLYFVTSTSYPLARNLVDSIRNEVICSENRIADIIPQHLFSYRESVERAFSRIRQNLIISSWKDAITNPELDRTFMNFVDVPQHGCMVDETVISIEGDVEDVKENIWTIGGSRGWYYGNFLWQVRGLIDKMAGGVGLRRGRRSPTDLKAGDSLDFWRVILADRKNSRLLLFAEMKLPGEAWLEFRIREEGGENLLIQKATFRPRGIFGRIYWYLLLPFHIFIFKGMAANIAGRKKTFH